MHDMMGLSHHHPLGGHRTFTVLAHLFSTLLDFLYSFGRSDQEKDGAILRFSSAMTHLATESNRSSSSGLVGAIALSVH